MTDKTEFSEKAKRLKTRTEGLHRKYRVTRTDGSSAEGKKHHRCDYFVLDLTHDKFAIPALQAYIDACLDEYPQLAIDLQAILNREKADGY